MRKERDEELFRGHGFVCGGGGWNCGEGVEVGTTKLGDV